MAYIPCNYGSSGGTSAGDFIPPGYYVNINSTSPSLERITAGGGTSTSGSWVANVKNVTGSITRGRVNGYYVFYKYRNGTWNSTYMAAADDTVSITEYDYFTNTIGSGSRTKFIFSSDTINNNPTI